MKTPIFPFTAIVGQQSFKRALLLNLVDPTIGGVLAIGDKGTGKTTLIRSLAHLMNQNSDVPFVNLPIGSTEDRLIGNINLETLINEKKEVVKRGLLNQANGGILYVDEVNLLQAHLMDILLDASASGQYYLEREGVSHLFQSRFCLVGSMNPEEGELRPQLKDRFGLGVEIRTTQSIEERAAIIKARLAYDADPEKFQNDYQEQEQHLRTDIIDAKKTISRIKTSNDVIEYCANLASKSGVEGLRADILLVKASRAFAALEKREIVSIKDVDEVADLVLFHRRNIHTQLPNDQQQNQTNQGQNEGHLEEEENTPEDRREIKFPLNDFKRSKSMQSREGQMNLKNQPKGEESLNVRKTVGQYMATDKFQLHHQRKKKEQREHYVFLLDASGSMLSNQINAYAKGAIDIIAKTNKSQKSTYSVVTLVEGDACITLNNNPILEELERALKKIETGGKTNLKAGLKKVKQLTNDPEYAHHLYVVTDGKFSERGSIEEYVLAFNTLCKGLDSARVVDAEQGVVKLGMARAFAEKIQANYEPLKIDL
ncbi:MAG: AAA family ATPase [Crocinitomicaceae bacterium]|nr:AAA family ATPase [Crocinitomicaceae bacterium]